MQPRAGERVVVAMSGGVDSSVAAALLVEAGFDVVGISMRLWGESSASGCCSLDDFLDARRVASQLRIPYYVMDFRDTFKRAVVDPFVEEYGIGRTPNPCVLCNQAVKFSSFWDRARELGAEWLATGHYARIVRDDATGSAQLWASRDASKDQSYFLFGVDRTVLERSLFPVGDLPKAVVREHAKRLGMAVADKPESQEICFAPKGDYASFVERHARRQAAAGVVVDREGKVLAQHDGVHRFTIGQRRGLGISASEPLYVTEIDAAAQRVRVGSRAEIVATGLVATRVNWLQPLLPSVGGSFQVKIRSRFAPVEVTLERATEQEFAALAPQGLAAVTPGQAAVLYDRERVVGGGWIERALH
ncbi:MAG: tRNA 2-thiouridine(34) synthase MnmA [Deltaproteobacteria bacterium]|nr:tRNA 2-thiouridine(34) synthase MnmA [Deltaproteobacteria bacterium]